MYQQKQCPKQLQRNTAEILLATNPIQSSMTSKATNVLSLLAVIALASASLSAGAAYACEGHYYDEAVSATDEKEFNEKLDSLYAEYDAIYASYGFMYSEPELDEKTWDEMDKKLVPLEEELGLIWASIDHDDFAGHKNGKYADDYTRASELSLRISEILDSYGYVVDNPVLDEKTWNEMNEKLSQVDIKIDKLYQNSPY